MNRNEKRMLEGFLKRLFPASPSEQIESSGEQVFHRLGALEPENVEAFRFPPDPRSRSIEPIDQLVMRAVHLLRGEGTARTITAKVGELSFEKYSDVLVLISLEELRTAGLVSRELREVSGKPRSIVELTERGARVLAKLPPRAERAIEELGDFA